MNLYFTTVKIIGFCILLATVSVSFKKTLNADNYKEKYKSTYQEFYEKQRILTLAIQNNSPASIGVKNAIDSTRVALKKMDFWLRYLEPIAYKKINGPLPVEWETEVFEKFEKPYKRVGAGLTLATLYSQENEATKDSLLQLIEASVAATRIYANDSLTTQLNSADHFFLCNRLFLLNLCTIYTSGFECPSPERIIPELNVMLDNTLDIYLAYNLSFPNKALSEEYFLAYQQTINFVKQQSQDHTKFDHYTFLRDFVNPLYKMNAQFILDYGIKSTSTMDYSVNKSALSVFDKNLYNAQNTKGVFLRVRDTKVLEEIREIGRLLFFDPILSGNNMRSCASCHKPDQFFTDTTVNTSMSFLKTQLLPRNTPSLLNAEYNHLLMADGKFTSLHEQAAAVITNPLEMACVEKDMLMKIKSCNTYKTAFQKFVKLTPQVPVFSMEHVSSALVLYYSQFSAGNSAFDEAMNQKITLSHDQKQGFNLFMGKAQCATCHFAPQFNGVKPPYVGSEFEVLGTPADTQFVKLSVDKGRYQVNEAGEMSSAFRTGTLRNSSRTKPYMHNGVFNTLEEVIEFYNRGGGQGRGLKVDNQTLSADSLKLSKEEKKQLIAFIKSLDEAVPTAQVPAYLPVSKNKNINRRKVGGEY